MHVNQNQSPSREEEYVLPKRWYTQLSCVCVCFMLPAGIKDCTKCYNRPTCRIFMSIMRHLACGLHIYVQLPTNISNTSSVHYIDIKAVKSKRSVIGWVFFFFHELRVYALRHRLCENVNSNKNAYFPLPIRMASSSVRSAFFVIFLISALRFPG
jgi:hypothetical protein